MTVEEVFIALGFKVDETSKAKAQNEANALKSMLSKALGVIGIGLSITGIKNFVQETASLAAEVRSVNVQFEQTFGDMTEVAEASLQKVSESTGIAESRMKEAYARMASFAKTGGMETAEANDFTARAMEAIADNAAYMDKSVEYTQETFQKLLKGNFQLDDNLNFNLAEAERNEMAMAMFQKKTYNDLTENEKKELILQKLIKANEQMGATGQAKREAGEYTNQVGELSDVVKQLKAQVGMIFLPHVLSVSTNLAKLLTKVAKALGDAEKEGTLAYKMSQKLTKAMDKFWDICKKVYQVGKKAIEVVGGIENATKLLAAAIGIVVAKQVPGYLSNIVGFLSKINLKTAAIMFGVLALFLVVDDFIGFMQGKESAIGHLIEKLGGDPDEVRNGITGLVDKIKELADGAFESLKEKAGNLVKVVNDTSEAISDASDNLDEFLGYEDSGQLMLDVFEGMKEAALTIAGALQAAAGALVFITGLDDIFTEGENVATSKGTERMSDEDAKKYKRLKHDLKGKKGDERASIENDIAALEEKYEGTDTTTAGQEMFAQGRANVHNSADRVFNGGRSQVDGSFSTMVQDTKNSIADFLYDITAGIVDLRAGAQDQNDAVTKDSADSKNAVNSAADSTSSDVNAAANKTIETMNSLQGAVSGLQEFVSGSQNQLQALAGQFPTSTVNDIASRQTSSKNVNVNMTYNSTFNGDTRSNQKAASSQLNTSAKDASTYTANALAFG